MRKQTGEERTLEQRGSETKRGDSTKPITGEKADCSESDLRKKCQAIHALSIFGRKHTGGLALQYNTAILHMHHLFIKYRKLTAISKTLLDGG